MLREIYLALSKKKKTRLTILIKVSCLFANKNVDIKYSASEAFLESPSSGTFNIEILEGRII